MHDRVRRREIPTESGTRCIGDQGDERPPTPTGRQSPSPTKYSPNASTERAD